MSYEVRQLQVPDDDALAKALAEMGLEWPWHDLLRHHTHPGARIADGTMSLVLHPVCFDPSTDTIEIVQSAMVLGPTCGVVARWPGDGLDEAFDEPVTDRAAFIVAVFEAIYETDIQAMTALEERVDDCELEVLDADGHGTSAQTIYHLEHELLTVRRVVGPMVAVVDRLARRADDEKKLLLAEWRERFQRLVSQMEDIDNLLTSILSVNLTLVSVRQNEDMRKIAAWGAIGIAPTALAGIWGMNFEHMPELNWEIGYFLALTMIFGVCFGLYRFFKRSGWL